MTRKRTFKAKIIYVKLIDVAKLQNKMLWGKSVKVDRFGQTYRQKQLCCLKIYPFQKIQGINRDCLKYLASWRGDFFLLIQSATLTMPNVVPVKH